MSDHLNLEDDDIESGIEGEFEFAADKDEDDLDDHGDGETLDSNAELAKLDDSAFVEVEDPEGDPTIDTDSDDH